MGGSFFVSAAQSLFSNRLIADLASKAPSVNPARVLSTGATQLQHAFDPSELGPIREAYMSGLQAAWILGTAIASAAVLISVLPEWKNIHAHKAAAAQEVELMQATNE